MRWSVRTPARSELPTRLAVTHPGHVKTCSTVPRRVANTPPGYPSHRPPGCENREVSGTRESIGYIYTVTCTYKHDPRCLPETEPPRWAWSRPWRCRNARSGAVRQGDTGARNRGPAATRRGRILAGQGLGCAGATGRWQQLNAVFVGRQSKGALVPISGACLCGALRYEISGQLRDAGNCHCSMCRKAHGAAYATYASVDPDRFRWVAGEQLVARYESSPGRGWIFCRTCGSTLGGIENGRVDSITLGTVEGDPGVRPRSHIFVGSKAPWHEITDGLPRFEEWPPGDGWA